MQKKQNFLFIFFYLSVFGVFSGALPVYAGTCTWTGSSSTDWSNSSNWSSCASTTPQSGDDVVIDGGTNQPTIDLSGGPITIQSLSIGENTTSTFTIENGDVDTKKLIVTNDVIIGELGILTHTANTTTHIHSLFLEVGGDMTVRSGGTVSVTGKGYAGASADNGNGPGKGVKGSSTGSGAGFGGNGGNASEAVGGVTYGSVAQPTDIGSSGGAYSGIGGSGGGVIRLNVSGTLTIEGNIYSKGSDGSGDAGGGSGGSIYLTVGTLAGSGDIRVDGGASGGTEEGGGGGGRLAIYYANDDTFNGIRTAFGGAGYQRGGAGTIFIKSNSATYGDLVVGNGAVSGSTTTIVESSVFNHLTVRGSARYVIAHDYTITVKEKLSLLTAASITNNGIYNHYQSTLTISANVTWYENGVNPAIGDVQPIKDIIVLGIMEFQNQDILGPAVSFNSMRVAKGGTLTHQANVVNQTKGINLSLARLVINVGGKIDVSGKGYIGTSTSFGEGNGPGRGFGGGGGGFGGRGGVGDHSSTFGGSSYGSDTQPTDIGSSGGSGDAQLSGSGAGAVKIAVTGPISLGGSIVADGSDGEGDYAGGGSGGSVHLQANLFAGSGSISARGGVGGSHGGGGGGGRIALYYNRSTFTGTKNVDGGNGYQSGDAGTIYRKALSLVDQEQRPTNLRIRRVEKGIRLVWQDNTDLENGYSIQRRQGSDAFKEIATVKKNKILYIDTETLVPGATYTYRVRAYKGSTRSAFSNGRRIIIPEKDSEEENFSVSASSSRERLEKGQEATFQVFPDKSGTYTYAWAVDGVVVSKENSFAYRFPTTGLHVVEASVTSATSVKRTASLNVTVIPKPPTVTSIERKDSTLIVKGMADGPGSLTAYIFSSPFSFTGRADTHWSIEYVMKDKDIEQGVHTIYVTYTDENNMTSEGSETKTFVLKSDEIQKQTQEEVVAKGLRTLGHAVTAVTPEFIDNMGSSAIAAVKEMAKDPESSAETLTLAAVIATLFRSFGSVFSPGLLTARGLTQQMVSAFGIVGFFRRKRSWGTTYDANTGNILSYVTLTLINQQTQKKQVIISDRLGRFGFLVDPGTYTIQAEKEGYTFEKETQNSSIFITNIYRGDPIVVTNKEFIRCNILVRKPDIRRSSSFLGFFNVSVWLNSFFFIVFVVSFFWTMYAVIIDRGNLAYWVLLLFNIALFFVRQFTNKSRQWGEVVSKERFSQKGLVFTTISVFDKNERMLSRTMADEHGRYLIFLEAGVYTVKVSVQNPATGESRDAQDTITMEKGGLLVKKWLV